MKKLFVNNGSGFKLDLGLLLIRLMIGVVMAFYGFEKLVHFSEMATSDFWAKNINFLGMSGAVPLGLTVFAELVCSILLIIGLFSRFSLLVLSFCMAYIFLVVFPLEILSKGQNGFEFNHAFTYFVIYIALLFTGVGKYSLDNKLFAK
jgi:putative oxidoreductase